MTGGIWSVPVVDGLLLMVVPPLAGVRVGWRGCAAGTTVALVLHAAWLRLASDGAMLVPVHGFAVDLTVATAAVALFALGRCCAAWWRHPLDASAVALLVSLATGVGVFAAGPAAAALGVWTDRWLAVSPIAAVASALSLDLLHSEPWYSWLPLAHQLVHQPPWMASCAVYVASSAILSAVALVGWRRPDVTRRPRTSES